MSQFVRATFENGVLRPHEDLILESGTTVRIVILANDNDTAAAQSAFAELERFRAQHPIHSRGTRLTRDQLHERC